ncbi:MAG: substrate-binding domain-containing protein [Akkermansiaceae bacterium]|nr:substrate-binding domain-containing protein [Armatimonadota bacterium]
MSTPLYGRIKEQIRVDYLQVPEESRQIPSERELQEQYQVSRPTISKALTVLATEGALVRQQRRGNFATVPQREPVVRASATSRQIGYVAPLAGEELIQRCFRGIDRIAHRRGYQVLMGNAGNSVEHEREAVRDLIASGVCGLVITPVPRRRETVVNDYLTSEVSEVPFVLADTGLPQHGGLQVLFDNRRLGYAMTEWLIKEGHSRIALLSYTGEVLHTPLAARFEGYRDALRDFGIVEDNNILVGRFDTALDHDVALNQYLDQWQGLKEPPTAIIAPEDTLAVELVTLLKSRGVRVPEDMRVVGFDNRSTARYFDPPIPTSAPDFERLGETACDLLLESIESPVVHPRTVVLDVPLLIRRAVSVPAERNGTHANHGVLSFR